MLRFALGVGLLAAFLGGCESMSTYASRGSCTPDVKEPVTPGDVVGTVAKVAGKFNLQPAGNITISGQTFEMFQVGEKQVLPRERLVLLVASQFVYVRLTDYRHDERSALDSRLEEEIADGVRPQYPCFRFVRYRLSDF